MTTNGNYGMRLNPFPKKAHSLELPQVESILKGSDYKDGGTGAEGDNLVHLGGISSQFVVMAIVRALDSDCLLSNLAFIPCQLCGLG